MTYPVSKQSLETPCLTYMQTIQNLTPYGIYNLLKIEGSCFGKELQQLFELPVAEKIMLYKKLSQHPPEMNIWTLEKYTKTGNRLRTLLIQETGFYLGAYHEVCPTLQVLEKGCLFTDSEIRGYLVIPAGGVIPSITHGWRAVYAEEGTIIQDVEA